MNRGVFPFSRVDTTEEVPDPTISMYHADEFLGGLGTSGNIGSLGWLLGAGAVVGDVTPGNKSHIGVIQLSSSATANTRGRIFLNPVSVVTGNANYYSVVTRMDFIFAINSATFTSFSARVGLIDAGSFNTTNETVAGVYVSTLAADTNWFIRHNGTRIDTGIVRTQNNWLWLSLRRDYKKNFGTINWDVYLNEKLVAKNLDDTGVSTVTPAFIVETNNTTAKTMLIDYFGIEVDLRSAIRFNRLKRYD